MQTAIDNHLLLRLMGYLHCFFDTFVKQSPNTPLPLIYPLIIYAGDSPWNAPLKFFDLFGSEQKLAQLILTREVNFIDIQRLPDETIEQHRWLGLFEFVVKYRKTQENIVFLKKLFMWLNEIELHNGREYSSIILRYVFNHLEKNNEPMFFKTAYELLSEELKGDVRTIEQALILRGKQAGIQQGIEEGIQKILLKLVKKV